MTPWGATQTGVWRWQERFATQGFEGLLRDKTRPSRTADASYGVLYAAEETNGAFAETFLRTLGAPSSMDLLKRNAYVRLLIGRDLNLIRLAGPGLARVGQPPRWHTGGCLTTCRRRGRSHRPSPFAADGIAYHARHDDAELCYALFDRSADAVEESAPEVDLDQDWFWRIAERYGVGLAP